MNPPEQTWNTNLYRDRHSFVWRYGEGLLDVLRPQRGERVLDLGCGLGQLTADIARTGALPQGIDTDAAMIAEASATFPDLSFEVADARTFELNEPVDAVFSNAVLHWIPETDQRGVAQQIWAALKPGGRLVLEMGGKGCVQSILDAILICRQHLGCGEPAAAPWYFPSVGAHASLLEGCGFEVSLGALFDRPTPLVGESGLASWILMFAGRYLADLPEAQQGVVIEEAAEWLRSSMYREGAWIADYRRLRMVAVKQAIV